MKFKTLVRALLPPIVTDVWRRSAAPGQEAVAISATLLDPEAQYARAGCTPWVPAYRPARERFVQRMLAEKPVMGLFAGEGPLPPRFGFRLDERAVEYPWLLARLPSGPGRLLDAGSALNHGFLLEQPALSNKKIHILTLGPEADCFWKQGVGYLFEDLRDIPVRDETYHTVVCVSTLEHIGMDNTVFTRQEAHREQAPSQFIVAVRELRRVLKPGGRLFLTVPFGRYENLGTQQQFDAALLGEAVAAFAGLQEDRSFFMYRDEGWCKASEAECRDCRYVAWVAEHWAKGSPMPSPIPLEPDGAASARAVACLVLRK